jgi:2'-5' RNA ligase
MLMGADALSPQLEAQKTARLFFALWPDGKTRDALDKAGQQLHAVCGGRRTRRETIHITLVFLGNVPVERIATVRALAAQINATPFELVLTKLSWWKHNRVSWAAPDSMPPALAALVNDLERALNAQDFQIDARPYLPHVTLIRKANCLGMSSLETGIAWKVEEYVLVHSVTDASGAAYEVIGRWPLATTL